MLLVACTLLVYLQVSSFDYVRWDDPDYIYENRNIKQGLTLDGVIWAFTTSHAGNWHPLTWLSHMLDIQIYGMNAGLHHLTNLIFHIGNILLLFLVLHQMTGSIYKSGFVAALFAIHPLHVESVAWISERKDVLSTFLWLLTIWAYIRYVRHQTFSRYIAVVFFLALGLMSKPMLVTLPLVLLLLDYWPLTRRPPGASHDPVGKRFPWKILVLEKIPLLMLVIISIGATLYAQKNGGAVQSLETIPFQARLNNAAVSYLMYIAKMVYPLNLAYFYPHPVLISLWKVFVSVLCIIFFTLLAVWTRNRHPFFLVGWFWYLGTLLPVIGLIQVGSQSMADRYTYVPLIGIFIIIAWGAPRMMAGFRHRLLILGVSSAALLFTFSLVSHRQVGYWRDSISLFQHAAQVTEDNFPANFFLAEALFDKGNPGEATRYYHQAAIIAEKYGNSDHLRAVHHNLARISAAEGKTDEALIHYSHALNIQETHDVHLNIGTLLAAKGNYADAAEHIRKSLNIEETADALTCLGNVQAARGELDNAMRQFDSALKLSPDDPEALYGKGAVFLRLGQHDEAVTYLKRAAVFAPSSEIMQNKVGNTLIAMGKAEEAIDCFNRILVINPDQAETNINLGIALTRLNKIDQAIIHYRKALQAVPGNPEAHNNIGVLLAKSGKYKEALGHFKSALELKPGYGSAETNISRLKMLMTETGD